MRDDLTALAKKHGAVLKIVELPPGPPVLSSLVAEVYGRPDHTYDDLLAAAQTVAERFRREPGVADVDTMTEAPVEKLVFVTDQEKAATGGHLRGRNRRHDSPGLERQRSRYPAHGRRTQSTADQRPAAARSALQHSRSDLGSPSRARVVSKCRSPNLVDGRRRA